MWGFSGSLGLFDSGVELSRGGVSVCLAENDRKEEMKEEDGFQCAWRRKQFCICKEEESWICTWNTPLKSQFLGKNGIFVRTITLADKMWRTAVRRGFLFLKVPVVAAPFIRETRNLTLAANGHLASQRHDCTAIGYLEFISIIS